jgi:alkylation response protein AidB-like acyl-CoA dehydrogenase
MKFSFSDEQQEFRTSVRRFLEDTSPTTAVRKLMETERGYDPDVWKQLGRDLGLTAIHIPEAYGGQGFGISELAIAVEEAGRALLCAPLFASTVLAATAILNAGTEAQKKALLPAIASGDKIATVAFVESGGSFDPAATAMAATFSGGKAKLTGTKSFVLDGHTADLIVVLVRRPGSMGADGLSLAVVAGNASGLERRLLQSMDPTRKLARLTFNGAEAELIGEEGKAAAPVAATLDIAAICLANEMVGGAERLRESAIEFAKMRYQFGRAIASFQSLKHKAADMLLEVEMAKSAAYYAAAAADENDPELPAVAALAKAAASEAYMQTAIHAVQIHGGIGFTWDNDTHLWFKRAKASEVLFGDAHHHRELMMRNMTKNDVE